MALSIKNPVHKVQAFWSYLLNQTNDLTMSEPLRLIQILFKNQDPNAFDNQERAGTEKPSWWIPNEFETSLIITELFLIAVLIVIIVFAWRYYQQYIQQVLDAVDEQTAPSNLAAREETKQATKNTK